MGYKIISHPAFLTSLASDKDELIYIHEHIREDAYELYGFYSLDELDFFKTLLGVSGVGPKVGLAIISSGRLEEIKARVMKGEVDWLCSLPGIGKKTAQKIVLELKGQLIEPEESILQDKEVIDALCGLGYSSMQAKEAVKYLPPEITETSERMRAALKFLSK